MRAREETNTEVKRRGSKEAPHLDGFHVLHALGRVRLSSCTTASGGHGRPLECSYEFSDSGLFCLSFSQLLLMLGVTNRDDEERKI